MSETLAQSGDILISGFSGPEKMYYESVREESTKFLEKMRRYVPLRSLEIRQKSSTHGKSRLFEIRLTARLARGMMYAYASERDLYQALRKVFSEITEQADKASQAKSGIRAKEKGL